MKVEMHERGFFAGSVAVSLLENHGGYMLYVDACDGWVMVGDDGVGKENSMRRILKKARISTQTFRAQPGT